MKRWIRSGIRIVAAVAVILLVFGLAVAWVARGPLVGTPDVRPVDADVSPAALRTTVETLTTWFRNRWITHPETLAATATWIADDLRASGLDVSEQTYDLMEGTMQNVVAIRRGTNPDAPVIVIGAHYDAYGELPGADDNASGVAALLELARTLPREPGSRTLHLVAFVNEEPPLFGGDDMGSYRYARHLADSGVQVELMVSLEMLGCFRDEPGSQRFPSSALGWLYPGRGNFIAVIGDLRSGRAIARVKRAMLETGAIPVYSFRGPSWVPGVDWSDHSSFRRLGFPAVMVTDTAFLRNPRYHTRRGHRLWPRSPGEPRPGVPHILRHLPHRPLRHPHRRKLLIRPALHLRDDHPRRRLRLLPHIDRERPPLLHHVVPPLHRPLPREAFQRRPLRNIEVDRRHRVVAGVSRMSRVGQLLPQREYDR